MTGVKELSLRVNVRESVFFSEVSGVFLFVYVISDDDDDIV